jgi:predicted phosphodiesterase
MKSAVTTSQRTSTNKMLEQLREIREEVARTNRWPAVQLEENSDNESLVVLLSDFHVGKVVQDESSRCLFDVAKAIVRIDSLRETVWQILVKNMLVDEVVLILAGDLVDGEGIYPGQEMHLEVHVADQIKAVTTSLWKLITDLSGELKVRVVTCRGNHGRTGLSDEANWDNIVYQQLEILADMQNDSHLAVKNLYGNFNTFEVRGWKGLVRHNAPMQADTGAAIAKFAGWHSIHQYDFLCYGHWHHWGVMTWNGKPLFRNGSLGGGDDYAEGFGAYDYPTQLAFIVSEDELIRNIYPISFKD